MQTVIAIAKAFLGPEKQQSLPAENALMSLFYQRRLPPLCTANEQNIKNKINIIII